MSPTDTTVSLLHVPMPGPVQGIPINRHGRGKIKGRILRITEAFHLRPVPENSKTPAVLNKKERVRTNDYDAKSDRFSKRNHHGHNSRSEMLMGKFANTRSRGVRLLHMKKRLP